MEEKQEKIDNYIELKLKEYDGNDIKEWVKVIGGLFCFRSFSWGRFTN